ncbi:MAG: peptide deformylase [Desulfovibrionaceae bacterium]|nr:peptide deformylase [Desulfovibrionaceae bacterium]
MLLPIVVYPNPTLKKKCEPVLCVTEELRTLVENMFETMYQAPGVGLAAPQVGENIRLLVMDPNASEEQKTPRVLINPELTLTGETIRSEREGCLSVPLGFRADVMRSSKVHLKARDLDWNIIEEDLEGYPAIIVQHETDHLDGTLFIDRISRLRRSLFDSKVKKWLKKNKNTR